MNDYADISNRIRQLAEEEDVRIDSGEIDFACVEAMKRHDGDVLFAIAQEWYLIKNEDEATWASLLPAAAECGSILANYWLAQEYRRGNNIPRDYRKAYLCYLDYVQKSNDMCDFCPPIDPEKNNETMRNFKDLGLEILEVCDFKLVAEILLNIDDDCSTVEDSISWWEFVLEHQPSRVLKCGLGSWYVGVGDFKKGAALIEQSADEGFRYASCILAICYASDSHKDMEKGCHWLSDAEKHGFNLPSTARMLGMEAKAIRRLKDAAKNGNVKSAALLAAAYLHGCLYGEHGEDRFVCERNEKLAREYGVKACMEDEGANLLFNLLDGDKSEEIAFFNDLTKDLVTEELDCQGDRRFDDNDLVQDEEGNWGYRGDIENK